MLAFPNSHELSPQVRTGVLLLHGLTGLPAEMRPVAKQLTKLGCIVDTPLLAGHGGDHTDLLKASWKDWLSSAREALKRLEKDCDHVVVAGLSMGALLAVMLAAEEPSVSGIALISTTMRYDGSTASPFGVLLPLVDIFPFLGRWCYWTELPPYGLKDMRLQRKITQQIEAARRGETSQFGLFRTYAGSLRQMDYLVKQVRKHSPRVKCSSLVIHSLEDTITSIDNATEICTRLGSRDKSLVLLSGCDHVLTLDLRKKDVVSIISNFVCELSQRRSGISSMTPNTVVGRSHS